MKWDIVKLGDACREDKTHIDGKSSSKPYLGLEMIEAETGRIDWSIPTVKGISTCYSFDTRHILYGKLRPYLNKVALPTVDGRCTTEIIPLLPNDGVCREYIAFLLRRKETIDYVMPENTGSRMPRADMEHLLNMEIPLPLIDEQRRIAAEIERQFAAVERAKRAAVEQLATARELNTAYLREVFEGNNWEFVSLGSVCKKISSGKNKRRSDSGQYCIYGSTGVIGYSDAFEYERDAILVARVGANCGYVHIATGCYDVSDNTLVIEHNDVVLDLKFAYYLLMNMNLNQYANGGGQPLVTAGQLKALIIPLPTIDEQHRIATKFERLFTTVERTIRIVTEQLYTINAIPTAILRQAFSGQV